MRQYNHLIGELVKLTSEVYPGLIVATHKANVSPLVENSEVDYQPIVYYVLTCEGRIRGPLFSSEVKCIFPSANSITQTCLVRTFNTRPTLENKT